MKRSAAFVLFSGCALEPFRAVHLPFDGSADGWRIDEMIHVTTGFVALIFFIMIVWMGLAFTRHGKAHVAHFDHGEKASSYRWTLGTAGLIFFVVDGHLLVNSLEAIHEVYGNFEKAEAQAGAVRLEVTAHQWAWAIRYPGPDGAFGTSDDIVTLNEVVLPVGRAAIFQVASTDVVHGFNVPNMRMKVDAVPGTINHMWFTPKEPGTYEIACAQHCGANHYKMRGTVTVVPQSQYDAWLALASSSAIAAFDPNDTDAHWGWDWSRPRRTP